MEDRNWYILRPLDKVIDLQQESLRWVIPGAFDISSLPIIVSNVYDKVIYVTVRSTMTLIL